MNNEKVDYNKIFERSKTESESEDINSIMNNKKVKDDVIDETEILEMTD